MMTGHILSLTPKKVEELEVGSIANMNVNFFLNSVTMGYTYIEYELPSGLKKSGWINVELISV